MDSSHCNDRIEPMQGHSALPSSEPPTPDRSDKTDVPPPDPARASTPWGSVRGDRAPKNEYPRMQEHAGGTRWYWGQLRREAKDLASFRLGRQISLRR
jgi:hypothetical protein